MQMISGSQKQLDVMKQTDPETYKEIVAGLKKLDINNVKAVSFKGLVKQALKERSRL